MHCWQTGLEASVASYKYPLGQLDPQVLSIELKKNVALHFVHLLKNPSVQAEQELKQVSQRFGVTAEFL